MFGAIMKLLLIIVTCLGASGIVVYIWKLRSYIDYLEKRLEHYRLDDIEKKILEDMGL